MADIQTLMMIIGFLFAAYGIYEVYKKLMPYIEAVKRIVHEYSPNAPDGSSARGVSSSSRQSNDNQFSSRLSEGLLQERDNEQELRSRRRDVDAMSISTNPWEIVPNHHVRRAEQL